MNIIVTHQDNFNILKSLNIQKHKIIVIGDKDYRWYKYKNISFMSMFKFLKTYRHKNIHSVLILDQIHYLHPNSLDLFKKQFKGVFSGSNLTGDDELYLAQVMGNLTFHLTSDWHDNYIDKNFLGHTSLSEDFIETFLSQYWKYPDKFNFNKYRTTKSSLVIYTKENIFKYVKSNKLSNVQDLISCFKSKYILSGCWYLRDENKNIINRLYKH